jgi:hypothetical protein
MDLGSTRGRQGGQHSQAFDAPLISLFYSGRAHGQQAGQAGLRAAGAAVRCLMTLC